MIAVVTSTIKPSTEQGGNIKSFYSFEERLDQTRATLSALQSKGFDAIFLIDNSPLLNDLQLRELLSDFPRVKLFHMQQYQFVNKGLNELLMLLFIAKYLPPGQNIFKITGRYYPTELFKKPIFQDIAFKGYNYKNKTGTISTRAYWIKDAVTFEGVLLKCLNEVFAYPERIVGARSLLKNLSSFFFKKTQQPLNISIEFAAANVLKAGSYNTTELDMINIEGLVAGAGHKEKIAE